MNLVMFAVGVTAVWVLAWGSLSAANVLSGLGVAVFLLVVSPDRPSGHRLGSIRPVAVARFVGFVVVQVVVSNVLITRQVLAPRPRLRVGVVAIDLPECSDGLLTLITNVIALSPGTIPLEVAQDPTVIYIHVMSPREVESARRDVQRLAASAFRAFGPVDGAAALQTRAVVDDTGRPRGAP